MHSFARFMKAYALVVLGLLAAVPLVWWSVTPKQQAKSSLGGSVAHLCEPGKTLAGPAANLNAQIDRDRRQIEEIVAKLSGKTASTKEACS